MDREPPVPISEDVDRQAEGLPDSGSPPPPPLPTARERELTLVRRVALRLHRVPPPPLAGGVVVGQETHLSEVPGWIDLLTTIITYALVFYGAVVASHWVGKDNFLVAIALLAIAYLLRDYLIEPLRRVVRYILVSLYETVLELVEFFKTWAEGVIQYFQGNFVRAVIRILTLALFMWIWNLALSIPAVKQLFDLIFETVGKVVRFVNDLFDRILGWIADLRKRVVDLTEAFLAKLGDLGQALRGEILGIINQLFAGVSREFQKLRFELLAQVDVTRKLFAIEIEILGVRIKLIPEEVRQYILARMRGAPLAAVNEWGDALLLAGPLPPLPQPEGTAPWQLLPEIRAEMDRAQAGLYTGATAVQQDNLAVLALVVAGTPPPLGPLRYDDFALPPAPAPLPGVPHGLARPPFIDPVEWSAVVTLATPPDHLAHLVAAIGWHETHWGKLGHGPEGYILGVGCPNGPCKPEFQGLDKQLAWAAPRLQSAFPRPGFGEADVIAFARAVWRPGDPDAWGRSVYRIYKTLAGLA